LIWGAVAEAARRTGAVDVSVTAGGGATTTGFGIGPASKTGGMLGLQKNKPVLKQQKKNVLSLI
jgi:hypothetical protein